MTTITLSLRSARWALALIMGMTGLLLGSVPAQAQDICGDLEDAAEDALDLYVDELDEEFSVDLADEDLCVTLTKNFIKACQTAVKDTVKCIQNQIKSLGKQNQSLCKGLLEGDEESGCSSFYKNQQKSFSESITALGEDEASDCEIFMAEDFFDICLFGF